jgi:hypothetical protein
VLCTGPRASLRRSLHKAVDRLPDTAPDQPLPDERDTAEP